MLSSYLTQLAKLKVVIGFNIYSEPIFDEVKEIKCRIIDSFKRVRNEKGEEVISTGVIQCEEPIKVGDYIDDRKVIAVNPMVMLEGIAGYKGYLQ